MRTWLLLLLAATGFGLALAACTATPPMPTAAPLPSASTATLAATATPPPSAAPSLTPVPPTAALTTTPVPPTATATAVPPTAAPTRLVLLAAGGIPAETLFRNITNTVQAFGWQAEWKPDPAPADLRAAAQGSANIIVVTDRTVEADMRAAAEAFPNSYFISLHLSDAGGLSNLLALGGVPREDQAGFMAGVTAGYATDSKRVAVIGDPLSETGRKYRNGFVHGVRYTCPKCRVDTVDVLNPADTASVVDLAAKYRLYGVDVFFAAAGEAGNAALVKVAQAGAWVIGSGSDIYMTQFEAGARAGADHVLTSVYLNPTLVILNALRQYHTGAPEAGVQSLSAANQSIMLAPYRAETGVLSLLDQQEIVSTLTSLGAGALDTGIDPETGEER